MLAGTSSIARHQFLVGVSSFPSSSDSSSPSSSSSARTPPTRTPVFLVQANAGYNFATSSSSSSSPSAAILDRHVQIDRYYDNLRQIHQSPDIFVIDDYLTSGECESIIQAAKDSNELKRSPIAYAGWTNDFKCWRVRVRFGRRRGAFVARETEERERVARNANVEQLRVGRTVRWGKDVD